MKRITVWGTTLKKIADEAQMLTHYKIIKKYLPDADVTMITYLKPSVQAAYPDLTIVPIPHIHKSLPRIFLSDLFIVAGGPYFDYFPHILKVFLLTTLLWLARVPILIYGVTGFPVQSWFGRHVFKWMGNMAKEIVTRDMSAFNSLKDMGVSTPIKQGTDLRAILDPAPIERVHEILRGEGIDPQKPTIGLTVRFVDKNVPEWVREHLNFKEESIDKFNQVMGKVVAELCKKAQVFIIAMNPVLTDDLKVAKNIQKYMDDPSQLKIIEHRYLATETLGIIQACDLLIAGRVGSAVFATMLETPLVAISHEHRMKEWMDEVGVGEYCFDWQELNPDQMLAQIGMAMAPNNDEIKQLFSVKAKDTREQAWSDTETYKEYLTA
jgi:polysaccharide pyruvyl transferase WcaK-like protein